MARGHKAGMAFILITVFIDVLGIGIIIPILPELVKEFVGGSTASAGRWFGIIAATYAATQFFFAPVLGSLSDRFGRRPIILIALFGLGVDYVIQGFAPSIGWLFIGRVIAGIMGASFTTANAYIADVSGPEDRARNFGLMGVAFGLGFIFGPALGGFLGEFHIRLPFFGSAALALINWLYGFFVLPESLPLEKRGHFSWKKANPMGSLMVLRTYTLVAQLAVSFVFLGLAQRGLEVVWVLYTSHRFGWDEMTNGLSLALVGIMAILVQGVLVQPFIKQLGERKTIIYGLLVATLAFLGYGMASEGWIMFVVIIFGGLSGVAGPAIQGLIAGTVASHDQGKIQGAITSLMSLTSIFAPLIFATGLFSYFTSPAAPFEFPGAPFLLGSILMAISFLILIWVFRRESAS
jgi:DHA1 family tetracycline resistance protein-like MFS transporter